MNAKASDLPTLETQLRAAVKDVMESADGNEAALGKVQELLDRKAALMRAPFSEKLRRIKATA
jgi:hypothetical protein